MTIKKVFRSKNITLITVTVVVIIFFYALNNNYLSRDNIRGILNSMSLSGMLGVGMACLLISGGVDLAVGAEACLGGIICSFLLQENIPWPLALFIAVIYGACAGAVNALLVNRFNFMGFIATIGMSSIYSGISLVVTNGQNIPISNKSFWNIGTIAILKIFPMPFLIMLVLIIIYGFVLMFTRFGRSCYMCGGNSLAARLSGLNPKKTTSILYINCGALGALAGSVFAARMHSASPTAVQTGAMDAITAAVLGGIPFLGGAGSMGGFFLGLLLLTSFNNGLTVIDLQSYWQIVAQGSLLIIALCADFLNERSRIRALKL